MNFEIFISLVTFTLTTTITPGPNNIMLLSSGLTFGYRKTLWHMSGIVLGFSFMVILLGFGIGVLFKQFPQIFLVLKYIGIIYLVWMAWQIANAKTDTHSRVAKPFSFVQALAFQWVNPKAWIVAMTSLLTFTTSSDHIFSEVFIITALFMFAGIISCNFWTLGGVYLKKFIKDAKHIKIFNITMAILLVGSIIPVLFQ